MVGVRVRVAGMLMCVMLTACGRVVAGGIVYGLRGAGAGVVAPTRCRRPGIIDDGTVWRRTEMPFARLARFRRGAALLAV